MLRFTLLNLFNISTLKNLVSNCTYTTISVNSAYKSSSIVHVPNNTSRRCNDWDLYRRHVAAQVLINWQPDYGLEPLNARER